MLNLKPEFFYRVWIKKIFPLSLFVLREPNYPPIFQNYSCPFLLHANKGVVAFYFV